MDFSKILYPIDGTVEDNVHFLDNFHNYVFSFSSPHRYQLPLELKQLDAFLLARFNPFIKDPLPPEEVYSYYTVGKTRTEHPQKLKNTTLNKVSMFHADGVPLGSVDILFPRRQFLGFNMERPNYIYDANGQIAGFCYFYAQKLQKIVYACDRMIEEEIAPLSREELHELEMNGTVRAVFSYELIQTYREAKDVFESFFSPSKKAESIRNHINMIQSPASETEALLLFTALMAFFWTTYIDIPMMGK